MFYKNGFPQSMQYTVEAEIFVEDLILFICWQYKS